MIGKQESPAGLLGSELNSGDQGKHSTADLDKKVRVSGPAWSAAGLYRLPLAAFKLWHYYRGWPNGCWKRDANVAEELNMSDRTVIRAREELRRSGWIRTSKKHKSGTWEVVAVVRPSDKLSERPGDKLSEGRCQIVSSPGDKLSDKDNSERVSKRYAALSDDDRFALFKDKIIELQQWLRTNKQFVFPVWDEEDSKQLVKFLNGNPDLTIQQFHKALRNYLHSENSNKSRKPKEFLPKLHLYFNEKLNRYGYAKEGDE